MAHFLAEPLVNQALGRPARRALQGTTAGSQQQERLKKAPTPSKSRDNTLRVGGGGGGLQGSRNVSVSPRPKEQAQSKDITRSSSGQVGKKPIRLKSASRRTLAQDAPSRRTSGQEADAKSPRRRSSGQPDGSPQGSPPNASPARSSCPSPRFFPKGLNLEGFPAFVQDYQGEEMLPRVVRREALFRHVKEMQQTYPERLKSWTSTAMMEMEVELAVQSFSRPESMRSAILAQIKERRKRPQVVEVTRMKDLYAATYEEYLQGHYKDLLQRQQGLQKVFFKSWRKVAHIQRQHGVAYLQNREGQGEGLIKRMELMNKLKQLDGGVEDDV